MEVAVPFYGAVLLQEGLVHNLSREEITLMEILMQHLKKSARKLKLCLKLSPNPFFKSFSENTNKLTNK